MPFSLFVSLKDCFRPLSTDVEKLWQVREPLYRSASDITVKSAEIPEKTAEEILKRIKG